MKMPIFPFALISSVALLAGCASDGGLTPTARLHDGRTLPVNATLAKVPLSPSAWPTHDWWQRYGDAQLNQLVDEALAASPTMRMAEARVRQAAAVTGVAIALESPQLTAGARSNRVQFSEHSTVPKPLAGSWQWSNEATLNFSYELDFWGKNRAVIDGALDRQRAAEVDTQAARLVLTVGVTQGYLKLAQLYAQYELAQSVLADRQQMLVLARQRVASHLDSQADLKLVELAIPQAKAELAAIDESIALARNEIAALLGAGPDRGLTIARPRLNAVRPPAVPSLLSSDLIARRPDVVAQRWRVEAYRKDIDASKALFYPSVNLNGLIGLQSLGFPAFLRAGSGIRSAGGALSLPIFDGGRLRNNLAQRNAEYDLAVEAYHQTLVDAVRDVTSQLLSIQWLAERNILQAEALATAQQAHALSVQRYHAGLGNYLQVLASEQQVYAQQRAQIALDARAVDLDLQLARALGGGFLHQQ